MKRPALSLLAAMVLLITSACGGGGGAKDAGADGVTDVTVGVIPIVDTAPIWLGKKQGFFKDNGINLELKTTSGGAAAVPGVVSGSFDFAFGNVISLMVAQDQGLPLKFVTNGTSTTGKVGKDFSGVVVPKGSPIKSPSDLEGKTVAVNNLKNIGDTTIRDVIAKDGGDASNVKFVEVAFPDAPAALAKKQVDAAWILEPFLSTAIAAGGTVVSWNYAETSPDLDIAGYFTTTKYISSNGDLVKRFQKAMKQSLEYAQDNPDAVRDIVGTYTEIDDATRAKMVLPKWKPEFNRPAAELLGVAATKYKTLSKEPDLDKLLP